LTPENIEKGDIVYLEIDSWILNPDGTKKLHDTTHQELAKQEKVFDEKKVYAEMPAIVGYDRMAKGLDEELLGKTVGSEGEITVAPEKGAGPRDPKLVATKSIREFVKMEIEPELGMPVMIGGRRGYISAVTAGRVRVDFNNPLAGKTIQYKYKISKKAEGTEDKVRGLIEMDYGLGEQFKMMASGDEAEVVIPDICKTDERWLVAKFRIVADLRELNLLKKIRFVEEYEKKEEKKEEAKPEEAHDHAQEHEEKPAEEPVKNVAPAKKKEKSTEEELPKEEKSPEEL
jgi:FKBP-type peptidyl-prolyl cis-trans isomerase 2